MGLRQALENIDRDGAYGGKAGPLLRKCPNGPKRPRGYACGGSFNIARTSNGVGASVVGAAVGVAGVSNNARTFDSAASCVMP